jgi:hypothetical protein
MFHVCCIVKPQYPDLGKNGLCPFLMNRYESGTPDYSLTFLLTYMRSM